MEPPFDTDATNGIDDTVSINDTNNVSETNGAAKTNGVRPTGSTASSRNALSMNPSLEDLQSDEQRRVLDTVSKVRKCGLDSVLSLPQIVVCGDQSSGKSSVLEALTEIPFPRNDNLCTRFATEICLRRHPIRSLTIRIIPGDLRSKTEQKKVKRFSESITDFNELPIIMNSAKEIMGIAKGGGAFAKDILSIDIQGPDRPHLALVDIPGLIQSSTKGVSNADVAMVSEITERYIQQPRTICLAVVSATNDAANQPILQQVRKFDPKGQRTLGVITKPDLLSSGSGAEANFLELARNENVVFNLGWHVVKNRKFEEKDCSIDERNASEAEFFSTSNFQMLPGENVGIDSLRVKLSQLLFEHVKNELPTLQNDLENALKSAQNELDLLGKPRSTVEQCRSYLGEKSMLFYELCRAGVNGHYEHDWFKTTKTSSQGIPVNRIRAIVQGENHAFANEFREKGHKYQIDFTNAAYSQSSERPKILNKAKALRWVKETLQQSRGTELLGNFNSNVIAELFWEQSEAWEAISRKHIEKVSELCRAFISALLDSITPKNIKNRIWQVFDLLILFEHQLTPCRSLTILPSLEKQRQEAFDELDKLLADCKSFPINYNHYYTDTIFQKRQQRIETQLGKHVPTDFNLERWSNAAAEVVVSETVQNWGASATADMEDFSCEEALDCLLAIYKVQQKTFIANVTTQVIERHIVRDLDRIFSPKFVFDLNDSQVENMASEPLPNKKTRVLLGDRIKKLQEGKEIFRYVIGI